MLTFIRNNDFFFVLFLYVQDYSPYIQTKIYITDLSEN